jgi:C4-dicarboxylate-specific signal transduction histidine kinase
MLRELLEADSETKIHFEQDGKRYFLNSRFVPELNWFLMVEQSEEQLLSPLRDTLRANIGLGLLITAIVAAICISAISRHHSRLEARNAELSAKNAEIQSRKLELEESARELAAANASLSAMNREKDDFLGIVATTCVAAQRRPGPL